MHGDISLDEEIGHFAVTVGVLSVAVKHQEVTARVGGWGPALGSKGNPVFGSELSFFMLHAHRFVGVFL